MSDFFKNTDEDNEAHAEERAFASLSVEEAKENARSIGDYFQASMASGNALQGGLGSYPKMSSPIQFSFEVVEEKNSLPLIPRNSVVALGASDGGSGKSTFALQLAASKACNKDIAGGYWRDLAPSSSGAETGDRVIYISCDDTQNSVQHTMGNIAETYALSADDMAKIQENLVLFSESTTDFNLAVRRDDGLLESSSYLQDLISTYIDQNVELVVIDTLRMATKGFSEQSDIDMPQILGILRKLADDLNATVLFIHNGAACAALMDGCVDRINILEDPNSTNKSLIVNKNGNAFSLEGNYPFRPTEQAGEIRGAALRQRSRY